MSSSVGETKIIYYRTLKTTSWTSGFLFVI
jgi:hypothetical protein